MGSKATEDTRVMRALMEILKRKACITWTATPAPTPWVRRQPGRRGGLRKQRSVYRPEKDLEAIKRAIRLAMKRAKQEGKAIAIGTPPSPHGPSGR
jgi:polysaccharide deacetylase 2 family uncharacterized protein YibQ